MGANPTGRAGRHGHLVVELRIRGELTAAVSRSATEAVESHGTRLISPCRGLGTNSKFEVVIPPRILSGAVHRGCLQEVEFRQDNGRTRLRLQPRCGQARRRASATTRLAPIVAVTIRAATGFRMPRSIPSLSST